LSELATMPHWGRGWRKKKLMEEEQSAFSRQGNTQPGDERKKIVQSRRGTRRKNKNKREREREPSRLK
jgi:hypothetical protein